MCVHFAPFIASQVHGTPHCVIIQKCVALINQLTTKLQCLLPSELYTTHNTRFLLFYYTNLHDTQFFEIYTKNAQNYTTIKLSAPICDAENGPVVFKKLILKILAIPAASGAIERLFFQCNIRCAHRKNRILPKNLRIYTRIHDFLKYTITRNGFCKYTTYTIHEKLDTRQTIHCYCLI